MFIRISFFFLLCWGLLLVPKPLYSSDGGTPQESAKDFFSHQKNYIPGSVINQGVKTIYVYFNIWQRDDGLGNFTEGEALIRGLEYVVRHMNNVFANSIEPTRPVEGVEYLRDSHIRFALAGVDFYQNSELYNATCATGKKLNDYVFKQNPDKRRYLNLHFTGGGCIGSSGYANYPSASRMNTDSFVVSFVPWEGVDAENYHFWGYKVHLIHEIGHNLGLHHPYDSEYCSFSHPDFLFDLFGFQKQDYCENPGSGCDVCYHQGGWSCDLTDPQTTCTNNLMGGNRGNGSITPLQMGRMNRALALSSVRKYAWGYSEVPYVVENDEVWDFNIKFYQDIVVSAGKTLTIKNNLEMIPQAAIILEPGSRLIVDRRQITNALYSDDLWRGVIVQEPPSRGLAFWRPRIMPGEIVLINGGKIQNTKQ